MISPKGDPVVPESVHAGKLKRKSQSLPEQSKHDTSGPQPTRRQKDELLHVVTIDARRPIQRRQGLLGGHDDKEPRRRRPECCRKKRVGVVVMVEEHDVIVEFLQVAAPRHAASRAIAESGLA